jgi:hypothetical protein
MPGYVPFSNGRPAPVGESPKVLMTDLWMKSRIDPRSWENLMFAQEYANFLFIDGDAYPEDCLDRDLFTLAKYMPPTFGVAMLRRRLLRGVAMRKWAERKGWPIS